MALADDILLYILSYACTNQNDSAPENSNKGKFSGKILPRLSCPVMQYAFTTRLVFLRRLELNQIMIRKTNKCP